MATKEVEPNYLIEPKHVKNSINIDYSSGTKNISITIWGDSNEDIKEMLDYTIKKWEQMKL